MSNISDLLKTHQLWIETIQQRVAARKVDVQDLQIPLEMQRQQADEISKRIESLGLKKTDAMAQFDTAIAKQKADLAQMKDQIARTEKLVRTTTTPPDDLFRQAQKAADDAAAKKQGVARPPAKGGKK